MGMWDFLFRGEPLTLGDAARTHAAGEFVTLPDGVVHYELTGPPGGQPVALIHGFSTPYFIWDRTAPALAAAGLRVLRYDLFGRGWSDRPDTRYNMALYLRQLGGLLDALALTRPVDLVGLSMGGAIAVAFTARYPDRVRRLALVDPAGLPMNLPALARLVQLPVAGEIIFGLLGGWFLLSQQAKDFYRLPADLAEFQSRYRMQMAYRGFRRALLSTVRGDAIGDRAEEFAAVGKQAHPKLLIMGRHDRTVPFVTHERILTLMPGIEFQAIEEAAHLPHYEQPEVVNPLLAGFLTRAPAG
jgi:pimeloyl-ACP methyl ester carboxylesterase